MLKIWDISTRIYHWLQAFLFFALVISAYGGLGKEVHTWLGTLLVVLLIWRIGWGVIGSETSRFSQFLRSPREIVGYMRGHPQTSAGHNPLGALMVIALIASLFLQGSIGITMSDWIEGKELFGRSGMRTLGQIHEINALLLIALTLMHIIAAIVYRLKGQHLIRAMFTGTMTVPEHISPPKIASNYRAITWLTCSIIAVVVFIKLL